MSNVTSEVYQLLTLGEVVATKVTDGGEDSRLNCGEVPAEPVSPALSVQVDDSDRFFPLVVAGVGWAHITPPEKVSLGGVTTAETEPVYQLFWPLGDPGDNATVGAPGPVLSKSTEKETLPVLPALLVAVQDTLYLPCVLKDRVWLPRVPVSEPVLQVTDKRPETESLEIMFPEALAPVNQPFCPFGVKVYDIEGGAESYLKLKEAVPVSQAISVHEAVICAVADFGLVYGEIVEQVAPPENEAPVTLNDTWEVYHPLLPFGEDGVGVIVTTGIVVSIFTVAVAALVVSPVLSITVQLAL